MKKDIKKSKDQRPKRQINADKAISLRVPVEAYTSLKKLAEEHDMSVNGLLNFYIQEVVKQETDDAIHSQNKDNLSSAVETKESSPLIQNFSENGSGIRLDRIELSSPSFIRVYFRGFNSALLMCSVIPVLVFLVQRQLISFIAAILLSIVWAIICIVRGIVSHKDGFYWIVLGVGWLVGTLSIVALFTLMFGGLFGDHVIYDRYGRYRGTISLSIPVVILVGIAFVGLLLDVPFEISNLYINRRVKKINEHVVDWGGNVCKTIINREICPDMTKDMVLLAWGEPLVIENREATKESFTEKWVYTASPKPFHVWFTDGVVNKINDTGT